MPNPIRTVLSATTRRGVRALLMGGQACILYGASEFSRDVDLAVLADAENLRRLDAALADLDATVIAVPPYDAAHLARGHAVHFRCAAADGVRLDVMARMRGVPDFATCWARRSVLDLPDLGPLDVLGLEDLVAAKKTRRDKDWPVVARLVERHYLVERGEPTPARVAFWLRELRTPRLLRDAVTRFPAEAVAWAEQRPAVAAARGEVPNDGAVAVALRAEEDQERAADQAYWRPLLDELEAMRRGARRGGQPDG